jgi:AraC-like DNA-binding protein
VRRYAKEKLSVLAPQREIRKIWFKLLLIEMTKVLQIKNMVCPRCIETVDRIFGENGFKVEEVKLGEVKVRQQLDADQLEHLSKHLQQNGFELLTDRRSRIVGQVKSEIIRLVHHSDEEFLQVNLSEYLSNIIGTDYSTISHLFSSVEGITIEKFTILQKIERVKELLSYGELTISEIAFKLGYSSSAHLSSQFKKATGMTPNQYKKLKDKERKSLDEY